MIPGAPDGMISEDNGKRRQLDQVKYKLRLTLYPSNRPVEYRAIRGFANPQELK
jgi:hypothetical protein